MKVADHMLVAVMYRDLERRIVFADGYKVTFALQKT